MRHASAVRGGRLMLAVVVRRPAARSAARAFAAPALLKRTYAAELSQQSMIVRRSIVVLRRVVAKASVREGAGNALSAGVLCWSAQPGSPGQHDGSATGSK